jgi:serine/threonine protein kinase
VLIDQACCARLADFGLLTVISDSANFLSSSSHAQGGTLRWMSPELIAPEEFGVEASCPTKSSDCYSLGMVIYEAISGNKPFHGVPDPVVFLKVVRGERPLRRVGFAGGLWEMLERCWMPQPNDRPGIGDVLEYLESLNSAFLPASGMYEGMEVDVRFEGLPPSSMNQESI